MVGEDAWAECDGGDGGVIGGWWVLALLMMMMMEGEVCELWENRFCFSVDWFV